jgi:hypothetical protein
MVLQQVLHGTAASTAWYCGNLYKKITKINDSGKSFVEKVKRVGTPVS